MSQHALTSRRLESAAARDREFRYGPELDALAPGDRLQLARSISPDLARIAKRQPDSPTLRRQLLIALERRSTPVATPAESSPDTPTGGEL